MAVLSWPEQLSKAQSRKDNYFISDLTTKEPSELYKSHQYNA